MRGRLDLAAVLVVVAAIVAAAHWPVLRVQAESLDDDRFILNNTLVSRPGWPSTWQFFSEVLHPSSVPGYYLPVTMTSLMLDYAMGGTPSDFHAFHRTNLVLHVTSSLLVVLLLYQLFGGAIPAGIVGLLFGVHPVMVEAVAWLSQRKTLLATCFGFGCLVAYVRHHRSGGRSWWNAGIVLHALALLCKPTVVTLPILLLLLDWWPLRRQGRPALVEKWPFFLLSLMSSVIAGFSQVGTMGTTALPETGPLRLFVQICYLQVFHLGQILWPHDLSSLHPPPIPIALSNPVILFSVLAVCALTAFLLLSGRRSRGPLTGWLFYLVALAPTFGVLVWSQIFVYDNYLYFPLVGILLLVGSGLAAAWRSPAFGRPGAKAALLSAVTLVAVFEINGTRATLRYWRNSDTLWHHILEVIPDSHALREKYGVLLSNQERYVEAIPQLRLAVELDPTNGENRHNLGRALRRVGQLDAALPELATAASLVPSEPEYSRELALALRKAGKLTEAESAYNQVLRLNPRDADALGQGGTLLALRGESRQALEMAHRAVLLEPQNARTHFTLAVILLHVSGVDGEVIDQLRQAVRYQPDWAEAYNELAWVLATNPDSAIFDPGEALQLAQRAVELSDRKDPGILDTYAAAQAAAGQFAPAVETARDAARLAASLQADSLVLAIHRRIAIYQRGLRFTEDRRGRSGSR